MGLVDGSCCLVGHPRSWRHPHRFLQITVHRESQYGVASSGNVSSISSFHRHLEKSQQRTQLIKASIFCSTHLLNNSIIILYFLLAILVWQANKYKPILVPLCTRPRWKNLHFFHQNKFTKSPDLPHTLPVSMCLSVVWVVLLWDWYWTHFPPTPRSKWQHWRVTERGKKIYNIYVNVCSPFMSIFFLQFHCKSI